MTVLWLLVARGGSKGVPGKNLKRIGGISLIDWKIRAARAVDPNAYIVCSSDSQEILAEAARCGASMMVNRPPELATDTASSAEVIRHALSDTHRAAHDTVVLLEPSAPFTSAADYRKALQMMEFHDADLVVGMKHTSPHPLFIGEQRADMSITPIIVGFQRHARRRQDYPQTWTMNGACYVFRTSMFLQTGDIYGGTRSYGLLMDHWHSIEIDTPDDLEMAEYAAARGYVAFEGENPRPPVKAYVLDYPTVEFHVAP